MTEIALELKDKEIFFKKNIRFTGKSSSGILHWFGMENQILYGCIAIVEVAYEYFNSI